MSRHLPSRHLSANLSHSLCSPRASVPSVSACKWCPLRRSPLLTTGLVPPPLAPEVFLWRIWAGLSPLCVYYEPAYICNSVWSADPSALVIQSCRCSRICSILSSSLMIGQQMATKMARINVRSMTNRTSILHDFTVSQRADMLLLTETNTFNLAQAWCELSSGGSVRKKIGPHSRQEPGGGGAGFFLAPWLGSRDVGLDVVLIAHWQDLSWWFIRIKWYGFIISLPEP